IEMRSKNNRLSLEGRTRRIFHFKRSHYRRRGRGVRHCRENALRKMRALLAPSRKCRPKCGASRFVRPLRERGGIGNKIGGASSREPVNVAPGVTLRNVGSVIPSETPVRFGPRDYRQLRITLCKLV